MLRIIGLVLASLSLLAYLGVMIVREIRWDIHVEDRLKRAADANTVEIAEREVDAVVRELERRRITHGYTSIVYNTPDEDVGFWFRNLRASREELRRVRPDATQLERSNVLMKLRETLLDGTSVTQPSGIAMFPHNAGFMWWGLGSLFAIVVFGIALISGHDDRYRY